MTYRQAADVQPFANTLVKMDLTGAPIKKVLEQQWQRDPDGNVPSRPFLRLGASDGLHVDLRRHAPEGDRITGMWLDGEAIDADDDLPGLGDIASSPGTGDNFWAFAEATTSRTPARPTCRRSSTTWPSSPPRDPLPVDYRSMPSGSVPGVAAEYAPGDTVAFDLSSLAMTGRMTCRTPRSS